MESLTKLIPALIAARGKMPAVLKDAENPHFRSRYADLATVLDACEPALGSQGLAVLQTTRWADSQMVLHTDLVHTSGERISSEYPLVTDYTRPQLIGAALTYARRYTYLCIVGIAPEDDDGESAMGRGAAPQARRREPGEDPAEPRHQPPPAARNGNGEASGNGPSTPADGGDRRRAAPPQRSESDGRRFCTDAQKQLIERTARRTEYTPEGLAELLQDEYGVAAVEQLDTRQASQLIDWLRDQENARAPYRERRP